MDINSELKELKAQMDEAFRRNAAASRDETIKTLPAGSPIPSENKIFGKEHREKFHREAEEIRNRAYAAIRKERERVSKEMTEAPSADAVNAINMMKMTSNLTLDDVGNMLDQYGSNYSCYRAITSVAADAGVRGVGDTYGPHKYDQMLDGLDYVQSKVANSFSAARYEKEGVTIPSTLGFNTTVDQELPE